jgi:hypothetical protein
MSQSATGYYLYKISGGPKENDFAYVGQARSAQRVLTHLSDSSNGRLKQRLIAATKWPTIACLVLPEKCHGDLGIGESALIAVEKVNNRAGCLNGRNEAGAVWSTRESPEHPDELFGEPDLTEKLWSFPFCRSANENAVRDGVGRLMRKEALPTTFAFLPIAGTTIDRVTLPGLYARLSTQGVTSAFVVYVNKEVSADRPAISPGSTATELAERCLKWWPSSVKMRGRVAAIPPQALIAVLGGPAFRIVVGAWKLRPDGYDAESGECEPATLDANFCDLQGSVLSPEVLFRQASFPILWLHEGKLTWVGH